MSTTYRVTVTRDEAGFWIATAPDVPGAHTFARRLDQLPQRMAEAISLFVDLEPTSIGVQLDVDLAGLGLGGDEAEAVHEAEDLRAELAALEARLHAATRRSARALASQGVTLRDSASLLGVSYQRVHQLLQDSST